MHSSLATYLATRYQLLLVTCKTLLIFAFLFLGGGVLWGGLITFLAATKIENIRKEKWPSHNESKCAFNDPAMDVASNHFAVFSQRIDVTPCRSAEETA